MAKAQNSEEKKICHWISTCNPGIGIHMFVPMMLVSLALIIRQWQAVREVLLTSIPICCFTQVELQRLDSVFWLILCNIIIVLLSIESGLLRVTSSTDQYGDSSSFVQEIETWPKQQSALEGTGTESREAPGKNEWVNSISMSLTVTQPEQKQPSAKRTRTRINGMTQGKRQDDSDMKNSMAQDQALGESEPMVTVDGSSDELRQRCDDFIAQFRNQIHFQNS